MKRPLPTERLPRKVRQAIIAKAREAGAQGDHEFARRLFATVGICYVEAEFAS